MSSDELGTLASRLGGTVTAGPRTTVLTVHPDKVVEACKGVSSLPGWYHLSTITGMDLGQDIAILYHFWQGRRFVQVRTQVPKSAPRLKSISGDVAAGVIYEAEIQDVLGVSFEGNPFLGKRLILPDAYPSDAPPPLQKGTDPHKIKKMMELE
ncbi:MAG TPA: NADH-quinone oxidoreductase subunit C [Nitrososphaerales archaeon]|nr:NADH-quinone oxidoreductase subunit C [Nitrososphaerales archaeon]